ncbi:leader peptidase (prepilin peptidase)/N-methyltransferase [Cutibacterium sp. WCA-380-WT-3A]|uniref:Leader peptidase (Prepilin peptidase)/N-methyltransferase n=1 Tax=Cutibacterium porci TaxID=2605781 RepID=A0A7K0J7G0_9ACTN|nr:leader peptidase (prepilin peptidase)/N-methyltransferase [Cutibacterium porci]MSS45869.1 leader peptidase (prepilin peptidase)/N-methyltransferase [Cutibacterium porci]
MWIILGCAVACVLAIWHLHVTVPHLVEPSVEEVGDAVLAVKPRYDSLATSRRTVIVAMTAIACGAASTLAPPWAWGMWWVWSGSVTTLVAVDHATTFLPLPLWRRCIVEAGLALVAGLVATRPPPGRWLVTCAVMSAASTGFFWLMWRLSSSLGYGDVRLAAGTGFLAATTAVPDSHPDFIGTGMTALLCVTVLGAVIAMTVTVIRKYRPSPWGSVFAYGPALWAGPWMTLAISLG